VEDMGDIWAIERSGAFKGTYHVLGGTLSAMDGRGPEALRINQLLTRAAEGQTQEIILALSATVAGQTTAHYLVDMLPASGVRISRLGQGIPVGGELDYMDEGTLLAAMHARQNY
jgi:recombination protein RecR